MIRETLLHEARHHNRYKRGFDLVNEKRVEDIAQKMYHAIYWREK